MKSYLAKPAEVIRKWYVVDANGKTLGRSGGPRCNRAAGQTQADLHAERRYRRSVVDHHAEKIHTRAATRCDRKTYTHHTGYPGGLKTIWAENIFS